MYVTSIIIILIIIFNFQCLSAKQQKFCSSRNKEGLDINVAIGANISHDIITTTTAFTFSYFIYFWFIDNVFGSASVSQCAQCLSITVLTGRHG